MSVKSARQGSSSVVDEDAPPIATIAPPITHSHVVQTPTAEEHDELSDTDEDRPKRKRESARSGMQVVQRREQSGASQVQVMKRREFTLAEFVTEIKNYKQVPAQWKSIVELVRMRLFRQRRLH
jgi:hypothetical protein